MSAVTLNATDLADLIQPDEIGKQGFLRPERVSLVSGTDHTGEEAFHVTLVFPDNTPDASLTWESLEPLVSWVRKTIRSASDYQRWAYIRTARNADLLAELS